MGKDRSKVIGFGYSPDALQEKWDAMYAHWPKPLDGCPDVISLSGYFHRGEKDDDTGIFTPLAPHVEICTRCQECMRIQRESQVRGEEQLRQAREQSPSSLSLGEACRLLRERRAQEEQQSSDDKPDEPTDNDAGGGKDSP